MKESTKARHEIVVDAYFHVMAELKNIRGVVVGVELSMADVITKKTICSLIRRKIKIYGSEDFVYQHIIKYLNAMPQEEYNKRLNEKLRLTEA